mmetsp:Transcript_43300/g.119761  ORF Transcript_43300/g.119761 Transcript_43300/m.119761 type:complete len:90 (-) Transcript_43300:90-359(-)
MALEVAAGPDNLQDTRAHTEPTISGGRGNMKSVREADGAKTCGSMGAQERYGRDTSPQVDAVAAVAAAAFADSLQTARQACRGNPGAKE